MSVHVDRVVHYHHPYTSLHPPYAKQEGPLERWSWPPVRESWVRSVGSEALVGYEVPFTERPRASGLLLLCSTPSLVTNHSPPVVRLGTRLGKCSPLSNRRQLGSGALVVRTKIASTHASGLRTHTAVIIQHWVQ